MLNVRICQPHPEVSNQRQIARDSGAIGNHENQGYYFFFGWNFILFLAR
jgi:hypothetical protein